MTSAELKELIYQPRIFVRDYMTSYGFVTGFLNESLTKVQGPALIKNNNCTSDACTFVNSIPTGHCLRFLIDGSILLRNLQHGEQVSQSIYYVEGLKLENTYFNSRKERTYTGYYVGEYEFTMWGRYTFKDHFG